MQKYMISFWKRWQKKFCKQKHSSVIDGSCDGHVILQKFANYRKPVFFHRPISVRVSWNDKSVNCWLHESAWAMYSSTLFTVVTVDKCLRSMKLGKAAGLDGTEVEHLLYAHPLLIVMLCVLFNIMLIHGVVPWMLAMLTMVLLCPSLKTKMVILLLLTITEALLSVLVYLNCWDLHNVYIWRPFSLITITVRIQAKMRCSHAIFLLRSVMDFYVSKSTTVNIAFQDLSKAFDKVNHNILFQKLMQRNVPGVLVKRFCTVGMVAFSCR